MIVYETLWLSLVAAVMALLVHEGGHLAGALAAGVVPRVLVLGTGPVVARLRRGSFVLVVRAVPLTGYVLVEPTGRAWAYGAMVAAGPAANLAALAATAAWAAATWPHAVLPAALAYLQGVYAALTLLPARGKVAGLGMSSDGLQLYRLLRTGRVAAPDALHAALLTPVLPAGASPPAPSRHAPKLIFALHRQDQIADPWARREVSGDLRGLLGEGDLSPAERALILCVLCAYAFVYDEGLGTAAEAEVWSREALALCREPIALDTRGGALLLARRDDEAERSSRSALDGYAARGEAGSAAAALCRAVLARTVGLADRPDEARKLWREAESAPAIAADPRLRRIVTRIKARALPARAGAVEP